MSVEWIGTLFFKTFIMFQPLCFMVCIWSISIENLMCPAPSFSSYQLIFSFGGLVAEYVLTNRATINFSRGTLYCVIAKLTDIKW